MIFGKDGSKTGFFGSLTMQSGPNGNKKMATQQNGVSYRNDGMKFATQGNMTYGSGGQKISKMGNVYYASNGTKYSLMGNVLRSSTGKSWGNVYSDADAQRIIQMDQ